MARSNRRAFQAGKVRRPYRGIKWGQRDPIEMLRRQIVLRLRSDKARRSTPKEGDTRMSSYESNQPG